MQDVDVAVALLTVTVSTVTKVSGTAARDVVCLSIHRSGGSWGIDSQISLQRLRKKEDILMTQTQFQMWRIYALQECVS